MIFQMRRGGRLGSFFLAAACVLSLTPRAGAQNFTGLKAEIAKVLTAQNVPGASVAVIVGNRVAWADGIGVAEQGADRPVKADTLFQAASVSKPVTAFAALRLAQDGRLKLDVPVDSYLKSVEFPEAKNVTLRQLLSHSSGLSVHGFGGYAKGSQLPTLQQILLGKPPANSAAVVMEGRPGAQFKYSGGGYCVVQQIVADVSGKPFPETMNSLVLTPIKMKDSTYEQPLPENLAAKAATAHDAQSRPIAGKCRVYPEMAAAGLWTTPTDLGQFIIAVQSGYSGDKKAQLKPAVVQDMLKPQTSDGPGLGLFVSGDAVTGSFSHDGVNNGFRCKIVASKRLGSGLVIMANSENGDKIYDSVQQLVRSAMQR